MFGSHEYQGRIGFSQEQSGRKIFWAHDADVLGLELE